MADGSREAQFENIQYSGDFNSEEDSLTKDRNANRGGLYQNIDQKVENYLYDKNLKKEKTFVNRLKAKCHEWRKYLEAQCFALLMILLSAGIIYYSNVFKVILTDQRVNAICLYISIFGYSALILIICYLSFYLPRQGVEPDQWSTYCPNVIPTASAIGCLSMLFLIIAIWPIYGFTSILLIFTIKLGLIFTVHFAPSGILGNIFFFLVISTTIFSGYYIKHDGYMH